MTRTDWKKRKLLAYPTGRTRDRTPLMHAYRLNRSPKASPRGNRVAPAPSSPPVGPRSPAAFAPRGGPQAVSESVVVPSLGEAARMMEIFVQRRNERDADGCAAMLVDDDDIRGPASAYGAVGKENVRNALRAWIEAHPGLHYTWRNVKVESKGGYFLVTFDYERRCDDESQWGRGRETVTLDGTCQRVRKVEEHGKKP